MFSFPIGLTRGVGFVRFNLKSEAEAAIKLLSGTVPPGATEPITVKFANQPTVAKATAAASAAAAGLLLTTTGGPLAAHGLLANSARLGIRCVSS